MTSVRPNEVSNGVRSGSVSRRTSMRSSFKGCAPIRGDGGLARPDRARGLVRALLAAAEDRVAVALDHEAEPVRDPVLQVLDLRALELDDLAAVDADEVVVVVAVPERLEAGLRADSSCSRAAS